MLLIVAEYTSWGSPTEGMRLSKIIKKTDNWEFQGLRNHNDQGHQCYGSTSTNSSAEFTVGGIGNCHTNDCSLAAHCNSNAGNCYVTLSYVRLC